MTVTEIAIHAGDVAQHYRTVGEISAMVEAATLFSKPPTLEDINFKLQEKASQLGADAVIRVEYNQGMSRASYKALRASGVAVVLEPGEMECPSCADSGEQSTDWATLFLEYNSRP
jgi:uncharacterized protein YbjQ (UPF0145 family)